MKEYAYQTNAMGSEVSVSFVCSSEDAALRAKKSAFQCILQYEKCFSRFLPESELTYLNTRRSMVVSDMFYDVYIQAIALSKDTQYLFNPLVQIATLGYSLSYDSLPADLPPQDTPTYNTDIEAMQHNPKTHNITLQPGQELDFGGFLKGYLSEKIAKQIQDDHPDFQGIIINLGGDLHTRGIDENNEIFVFTIYNPITQQEHPIPLHNQSLATSGTYKRTWKTSNITRHHILDKSGTKNAKTSILSASVIGENGATCEAYTKVLINEATPLAIPQLQHQNLQYLIINTEGIITTNI